MIVYALCLEDDANFMSIDVDDVKAAEELVSSFCSEVEKDAFEAHVLFIKSEHDLDEKTLSLIYSFWSAKMLSDEDYKRNFDQTKLYKEEDYVYMQHCNS